jgi:hypothetical protein
MSAKKRKGKEGKRVWTRPTDWTLDRPEDRMILPDDGIPRFSDGSEMPSQSRSRLYNVNPQLETAPW